MRLPPYPTYLSSGVDWLDKIPENWKVQRLKTTAKYWVSSVNKIPSEDELPVRLCNYTDVYYNEFIHSEMDFMETTATQDEIRKFGLLVGDVVITKDSEEWDDIAVPALVIETASDLVCGYHLAIIRSNSKKILGSFLFRALQSTAINYQFQIAATGVTRYGLPKSAIGEALIPLPPLQDQELIAKFLDHETSQLDALVAKKQELINKLKEKRTALISWTVTRGLPPKAARAAGLNPNPFLKPSGIEWLGDIPIHWDVKRIKHLGLIRYGLGEPPEYVDDGIPFIRATDINKGKIDLDLVKKIRREDIPWSRNPELKINEILIVRSGAYTGDSAIVTKEVAGCIAGYDMVLTVTSAEPHFLAWVFLSKYMLQSQIHVERLRAAQPHLNAEELSGFVVLVPPVYEQQSIAVFLNKETDVIDGMILKNENAIKLLQEYRNALITASVTGKIDVRGMSA